MFAEPTIYGLCSIHSYAAKPVVLSFCSLQHEPHALTHHNCGFKVCETVNRFARFFSFTGNGNWSKQRAYFTRDHLSAESCLKVSAGSVARSKRFVDFNPSGQGWLLCYEESKQGVSHRYTTKR